MISPEFIHLRAHSEYSITDGTVRLDDYISEAIKDSQPAIALTDLNNLFGAVKFYKAARGKGLKPIIGCDVWIENELNQAQPHRAMLLCQTKTGYLNLCDLISQAYLHNQHRGRPELKKSGLNANNTAGLIMLSGAMLGDIGQAILADNLDLAKQYAVFWQTLFSDRFYIELQRAGHAYNERYISHAINLASQLDIAAVATHPIQFIEADDFKAHEARVCIAEGYVLQDKRRPQHFTPQQCFKTQAEMAALFADLPEALQNSVEIAKRCNLNIELGKNYLPNFPTPNQETLEDYLNSESRSGLHKRLDLLYPNLEIRKAKQPEYEARLAFEITTIIKMGFAGYFLIVADFINWAKNNSVPVGPGRGSGAGSVVAYSLGITDLDPLAYNLLFERFLKTISRLFVVLVSSKISSHFR